ncbi:SGNH/GDSL hydrolase family protein [Cytophagaceae bacterium YF14B1]|uniref:SGNH/GDSL hydrolase family protein n=1 Tax=Xanthocytophaga flava TaxID=3048013 RepID=A0AAE3QX42_9BACT|nr:SGNH/GDSL hydrolase family protein [Xanthocytophaga flavus]MDJ1484796.1 SGNH/GDSL hydrolase family protein [Xanthocytophaga flavus]
MDITSTTSTNTRRSFLKKITFAGVGLTSGLSPISLASENAFRHIPPKKGLVILFQGDSITDGNRGRNDDPNHIMGHGYAFSIASRVGADFPDKNMLFFNRGISGNTVADLALRWQTDTLDLKPDVLSILIGINDSYAAIGQKPGITIDKFESTYRMLLTQTKEKFPDVIFVLCSPFVLPLKKVKEQWTRWHEDVQARQKVVEKLANEYQAVLVNFQPVFDQAVKRAPLDYWIWDGIHPTVPGHELMAREWIRQVSQKLTFLKKYEK